MGTVVRVIESEADAPLRRRRWWPQRLGTVFAAAFIALTTTLALATPAQAYIYHGCRWGVSNLNIDASTVSGNARTALSQAASNYTASTDTNVYLVNATSGWTGYFTRYETEWEGYATWSCNSGTTTSAFSRLNTKFLAGKPIDQLKVVWLHEMGHALGLGHVTNINRVMYDYATGAWEVGVRSLTSDEVAGINTIY